MITEKQLQDYARKIYEQQDGYTIEKAYKLFARLAIRISMYLNQLYIQEMKEKMTKLNVIFIGQYQNELARLDKEFDQLEKLNAKFSNQDISNMTLEQMMNTGILQQQYNIGQTGINMIDKYTKLSEQYGIPINKFQTVLNNLKVYQQIRDGAKEVIDFYNKLRRLSNGR